MEKNKDVHDDSTTVLRRANRRSHLPRHGGVCSRRRLNRRSNRPDAQNHI